MFLSLELTWSIFRRNDVVRRFCQFYWVRNVISLLFAYLVCVHRVPNSSRAVGGNTFSCWFLIFGVPQFLLCDRGGLLVFAKVWLSCSSQTWSTDRDHEGLSAPFEQIPFSRSWWPSHDREGLFLLLIPNMSYLTRTWWRTASTITIWNSRFSSSSTRLSHSKLIWRPWNFMGIYIWAWGASGIVDYRLFIHIWYVFTFYSCYFFQ